MISPCTWCEHVVDRGGVVVLVRDRYHLHSNKVNIGTRRQPSIHEIWGGKYRTTHIEIGKLHRKNGQVKTVLLHHDSVSRRRLRCSRSRLLSLPLLPLLSLLSLLSLLGCYRVELAKELGAKVKGTHKTHHAQPSSR